VFVKMDGTRSPMHMKPKANSTQEDIETIRRLQAERNAAAAGKKGVRKLDTSTQRADSSTKASLTETFDTTLYDRSDGDKYDGYNMSISANDGDDDMPDAEIGGRRLVGQYTATNAQINEFANGAGVEEEDILLQQERSLAVQNRESEYQKRRFNRGPLTPTRADAFNAGRGDEGKSYREIMAERDLEREEERVQKLLQDKLASGGDGSEYKATLKEESSDKENAQDWLPRYTPLKPELQHSE
jgi:splicing factor 3B subunit 1